MKIYIINGVNMNMLGIRETSVYGNETYTDLCREIEHYCTEKEVEYKLFCSNSEGSLVDMIQEAYFDHANGIVINPGAYTHTSIALLDAVMAVGIPTVEVHISDISRREEFRQISYIRQACAKTIIGHGTKGYLEAIDWLCDNYGDKK